MKITTTDYFFSAFENPFISPNRIAVHTNLSEEDQTTRIEGLDKLKDIPKWLLDQKIRIIVIVLIYLVSLATIIPLIVLTILAKQNVTRVEEETNSIEASRSENNPTTSAADPTSDSDLDYSNFSQEMNYGDPDLFNHNPHIGFQPLSILDDNEEGGYYSDDSSDNDAPVLTHFLTPLDAEEAALRDRLQDL